jgi:hypothetical protein
MQTGEAHWWHHLQHVHHSSWCVMLSVVLMVAWWGKCLCFQTGEAH